MRFLRPACLILALAAACAAGEAVLDLVQLRDKGPAQRWVVGEDAESVRWKANPDQPGDGSTTPRTQVRSITYAFMRQSGAWSQGMEARERGRYEESAELFGQLAGGGREAEQVVGSIEAGISWDLAGNREEAAKSFMLVASKFPKHPLALDARYRLGMALALAKDPKVEEVAKALEADSKDIRIGQMANVRAAAVRAAMSLAAGPSGATEMRRHAAKASFSPENERAVWLHFNLVVADALRAQGQGKDAAAIYERMLPALAEDPANAARVHLGMGLSRMEADKQGAIIEFLHLDALPFGSPDQKCEARFHAGRLLFEEHQRMEKDPATAGNESKAAFSAGNLATARLLLQAAADAVGSHPAKAQAAELLKTLPPEPGSEPPAAEGQAAEADPKAAPAKDDKPAPKKDDKPAPKKDAKPAPQGGRGDGER